MRRGEDKVTLKARIDDLNDNVLVCETNHKAILGRVTELQFRSQLPVFMYNDLLLVFCLRH